MGAPHLPPPQPRPQSTPAVPGHGMHAQQPLPGFQHVQQHQILHQAEQYHNMIAQRLQQLQRETLRLQQEMGSIESRYRDPARAQTQGAQAQMTIPFFNPPAAADNQALPFQLPHLAMRPPHGMPPSVQNFINQQQRGRAAEGLNGAGNRTPGGTARASSLGRASPSRQHRPDHTTTYTREGFGPNGERWQMTVNETTTTLPIGSSSVHHHQTPATANPALDVQAVLRSADRQLASQTQNDMLRSASNPNPSRSADLNSGNSTEPSPNPSSGLAEGTTTSTNNNQNSESMVYILSSPHGPRALLVSNSESYFTPRQPSRRRRHDVVPAAAQGEAGAPVGLPEYRNRPAVRARRGNNEGVAQIQQAHANPGAGALAARIGPIIWLIIRLVGVVWFLTSGDSSWTRWFIVTGLAFAIFMANTGLFNGAADQVWGPIRRHLEALLPLAGPDAAMVPAANAAIPQPGAAQGENAAGQRGTNNNPTPESTAARLIEQRRQANGNWVLTQLRRAEHALLLFLASLVPGVGERHIAAREAEAAERQRRIDAAVAAAEEAQREAEAANAPQENATEGAEGEAIGNSEAAPAQNEAEDDPLPPLIQV